MSYSYTAQDVTQWQRVSAFHPLSTTFLFSLKHPTRSFDFTMSQVSSSSTSSTNFENIFAAALKTYSNQTKKDIAAHPLASQLQSCDSPSAILAILQTQVQTFDQSQGADEKLTKWLDPTVNVLFAFSATLGNGVGVVIARHQVARDPPSDVCNHRYFHPRMRYSLELEFSCK